MSVAHASSFGNVWDVAICGKKHGGRAMVPKRKNEEEDDHAKGMGDSKKKKPKGPGIALVIAIGHKGKHDKDAMKKAWPMLKEQKTLYDPAWDQHAYDEQGYKEHQEAMAAHDDAQDEMRLRLLTQPFDYSRSAAQRRATSPLRTMLPPKPPRIAAQDVEGAPTGLQGTFSADYDPDAKEKDAGF